MADYSSPKPVDPIWYQPHGYLRIQCVCGRCVTFELQAFARVNGVSENTKIYRLIARLRCERCGKRPSYADVTNRRERLIRRR